MLNALNINPLQLEFEIVSIVQLLAGQKFDRKTQPVTITASS
jgi:hypothetical protein